MSEIIKDIYSDTTISPLLGFKGGTCAYFFYDLPRFSVDLDFDLLKGGKKDQKIILKKIVKILKKHGKVKEKYIKRYTIFALLSYGKDDHNIKVEINIRKVIKNIKEFYEIKEHLAIPIIIARKDYLFTSKLSALISREKPAMRDIFDVYYFAKNSWDINNEILKERTGKTIKEYLNICINFVEKIENNQILHGLAELVNSEKEKAWIKNNLKSETIFMLKNYRLSLEKENKEGV